MFCLGQSTPFTMYIFSIILHTITDNFEVSLFMFLCDEVVSVIRLLVLDTIQNKCQSKVESLALKYFGNIVNHTRL